MHLSVEASGEGSMLYLAKVTLHIGPGSPIVAGHASVAVVVVCGPTSIGVSIWSEVRYKLQTKARV